MWTYRIMRDEDGTHRLIEASVDADGQPEDWCEADAPCGATLDEFNADGAAQREAWDLPIMDRSDFPRPTPVPTSARVALDGIKAAVNPSSQQPAAAADHPDNEVLQRLGLVHWQRFRLPQGEVVEAIPCRQLDGLFCTTFDGGYGLHIVHPLDPDCCVEADIAHSDVQVSLRDADLALYRYGNGRLCVDHAPPTLGYPLVDGADGYGVHMIMPNPDWKGEDAAVQALIDAHPQQWEHLLDRLFHLTADPNWPPAARIYEHFRRGDPECSRRLLDRMYDIDDDWRCALLQQVIAQWPRQSLLEHVDRLRHWAQCPPNESAEEALTILIDQQLLPPDELSVLCHHFDEALQDQQDRLRTLRASISDRSPSSDHPTR